MIRNIAIMFFGMIMIVFAGASFLWATMQSSLNLDQILIRAIPYSFMIMVGIGVILRQEWGRQLAIVISFIGLALKVLDIQAGLMLKDLAQTIIYIVLLIFFTRKDVETQFSKNEAGHSA